jgi:Fe-S-cluster containining protein
MESDQLTVAVEANSRRPDVLAAVAELYGSVEAEIAKRRPLCVVSGRCCRFEEFGHRLYVTTMELAAFVQEYRKKPVESRPTEGGCPFQHERLCSVHRFRPMGCRMFFCDASSTEWQNEHYEKFHARLKRLHETLAVPYAYLEWRSALAMLGFK